MQQSTLTFQTDLMMVAEVGLTYTLCGCILFFLLFSEGWDEEKK